MTSKTSSVELLPAYLTVGEDQLKRESVHTRIRKRIASMGDIDFNSEVLDGGDSTADAIIASCNTLPFASEKRLVVIKNAEKLAKAEQEDLAEYIKDPTESTVLILLATKLAKNTRLYKAVAALDKKAVIPCEEKKGRDVAAYLRDMAVSKGVTLSPEAATALVGATGNSTVKLNTELEKIIAYIGSNQKEITVEDVEHIVATTAEVKPWNLQDAFSRRDVFLTATLLDRMFAMGETPYALLIFVTSRLRELISIKTLLSRGGAYNSIATTMKWPSWKVRNTVDWASKWSEEELRDALRHAADIEKKMKSGYDPELTFQTYLLGITKA